MESSTTAFKVRAQLDGFLGIFSARFSKPVRRFIGQMVFGIQAAQDDHRQNHVAVLSAKKHIPQNIIRDVPDQRNHLVVRYRLICVFHGCDALALLSNSSVGVMTAPRNNPSSHDYLLP